MPRTRLDQLMVARGLAENRSKAQALILAGVVRVDGEVQTRAGTPINEVSEITVDAPLLYVSRGGYKLAHALDSFGLDPAGCVALDIGASTGGFSDVLLQRGAALVYAVDVAYGVLDWRIRQHERVIPLERTNIRYLTELPPMDGSTADPVRAQCCSIDVSFISLRLVLPPLQPLIKPDAWIVALIKPQFEAGREQVGKGGVVRDSTVHRAVLREVLTAAAEMGLTPRGLTRSPLTGPAGNVEFLAWLQASGTAQSPLAIAQAVQAVVS
ncbi:MAG: TlyA family RNA methyltransferase [Chloroflexaceae bacterium]|nr:TlyA family RNA methyltransferase [Chloroflexaceae bacterium]